MYVSKKAISPLIASVLLIAITFSVAIFVSSWIQDVAKSQSKAAIDASRPECNFVSLQLSNANFTGKNNSVNGNYTLLFNIENTGSSTANIIRVEIIYADGTIDDGIFYVNKSGTAFNIGNITLLADSIKPITLNNTHNKTIFSINVISNCRGKSAKTKYILNNP